MLELKKPRSVKLFAGVLLAESASWTEVVPRMVSRWGERDLASDPFPFDFTDYYEAEMGPGLQRRFLAFSPLIRPEHLPRLKLQSNELEAELMKEGKRTVNLDVGYLDLHKIVLASTKEGPHRIYLGAGIWADMALRYRNRRFEPLSWTFMDFKAGIYNSLFMEMRARYKRQLAETPEQPPACPGKSVTDRS